MSQCTQGRGRFILRMPYVITVMNETKEGEETNKSKILWILKRGK